MCQSELLNIKIDKQKYGGNVVQWLSSSQGKKLGLATEFSEIPQIGFKFLKIALAPSADYDIILFPSKKQSRKFVRTLVKEMPEETLIVGTSPEEKPTG